MGGAAEQARQTMAIFRTLAAATLVLGLAMKAAGTDESMRLQLQAITHDGALAWNQIRAIREESERGLFNKEELFQARKVFDETGASIKELLPLSEELALRSGKGLDATARIFASLEGGGIARLGAVLRQAGLTVEQLRGAGLDVTKSYQVKSSPQETLRVLRELLSKDSLSDALGGSLSSESRGAIAALTELFRSIGAGLMPFLKPVLTFLTEALKTFTYINDVTHGWVTNILLAVGALRTIATIIPIMEALVNWVRIADFWFAILDALNAPWATLAAFIGQVIVAMKALTSATQIQAAWTAILDALSGNYVALATAGVVAAAVSIAWYHANSGGETEQSVPSAERPKRRSDVENMLNRARGASFS